MSEKIFFKGLLCLSHEGGATADRLDPIDVASIHFFSLHYGHIRDCPH